MISPVYFSKTDGIDATFGGNLPHWFQPCATFVTFRLADSLPQEKLLALEAERNDWLAAHARPWDEATRSEYDQLFEKRLQLWLDRGYGECLLRDASVRETVESVLREMADVRYSLYAYVVMPNHVHVLFMPIEGCSGRDIVSAWKSISSRTINRLLGRTGSIWQKESFDHLVRNVRSFDHFREYIRGNAPELAFDAYA